MINFRSVLISLAVVSSLTLTIWGIATKSNNNSTENTKPSPSHNTTDNTTGHTGKVKININSAILSELDKLEAKLGVPALSNKIQAGRPYIKPEDLVTKKIITQAQFEQIKDLVTIEDVILTGEAKDIDFMTKMGLMKGHLLVAKELLDLQKPDQAEPHIGHPIEEIYSDVEDQLKERKVKEFKTTLINLQNQVKSNGKDAKVASNFDESMKSVDDAIATLPETQRQSPNFVLKVINGLLDAANSEYGAAIAKGKITEAIEYQDSRGFVSYSNTLYKTIAEKMAKENPAAHKEIESLMAQLLKAWPSATPPDAPVLMPEKVSELIKQIENNVQKVVK